MSQAGLQSTTNQVKVIFITKLWVSLLGYYGRWAGMKKIMMRAVKSPKMNVKKWNVSSQRLTNLSFLKFYTSRSVWHELL